MASIWVQGPGHPPKKLVGHLEPSAAVGRFKAKVAELARQNNAAVVEASLDEAVLRWPDGKHFIAFLEFASPPSALEKGQPKIVNGHGLLIDRAGEAHELAVPR